MLQLKIATFDDVERLRAGALDSELKAHDEHWRREIRRNLATGPAFTAWHQGRCVGAAGVRLKANHTGDAWAIVASDVPHGNFPTAESLAYLEQVLASIETMIQCLASTHEITRLRALSRCGFGASGRLLKALGFEACGRIFDGRQLYKREVC